MKIGIQALSLLALTASTATAFTPSSYKPLSTTATTTTTTTTTLNAQQNENNNNKSIQDQMKGMIASTFMAAAIWASPPAELLNMNNHFFDNTFMNDIQSSMVADAKEMASGSGSRVNKDPESLLRLGLPIPKDKEVSYMLFVSCTFMLNVKYWCRYNNKMLFHPQTILSNVEHDT